MSYIGKRDSNFKLRKKPGRQAVQPYLVFHFERGYPFSFLYTFLFMLFISQEQTLYKLQLICLLTVTESCLPCNMFSGLSTKWQVRCGYLHLRSVRHHLRLPSMPVQLPGCCKSFKRKGEDNEKGFIIQIQQKLEIMVLIPFHED